MLLLAVCLLGAVSALTAQRGSIRGRVVNGRSNQPVEFAHVQVQGTNQGATTDERGGFTIGEVRAGFARLVVSAVGFERALSAEVQVQGGMTTFLDVELSESTVELGELVVRPVLRRQRIESPLSFVTLGVQEIEKGAGTNRDVSKALQTLPGVGAMSANRNDLIVRGGGPAEHSFYLDEVEIPVINHFSTPGASGGVVGMVNPDFVREVQFYTGAFPANRAGALSSVMDIRQRDGNPERLQGKASVGASDASLLVEGPTGGRGSFIASARWSYLQFLFKALRLPFLPTYRDFQIKYKYQLGPRSTLTLVGLGAIDDMRLNTSLQSTGTEYQKYLLSYLPEYKQRNYTLGLVYKRYGQSYYDTWVLSQSYQRHHNEKWLGNDPSGVRLAHYESDEWEHKLRYERTFTQLPFKLMVGAGLAYTSYSAEATSASYKRSGAKPSSYQTALRMGAYQLFAQLSDEYLDGRLKLSLGLNATASDYNTSMSNPLRQLSPRLSASYALSQQWDVSGSIGRYLMRPPQTTLGYHHTTRAREELAFIASNQAVVGIEHRPSQESRLSIEAFYKAYDHYPVSVAEGISLASQGVENSQIGDEAVRSTGRGRTYGLELYARIGAGKPWSLTGTYTFFRSLFTDISGRYLPSSWDTRHILNIMGSYSLPKHWSVSARWRLVGGAPYTPIDQERSTDKQAWTARGRAYLDYAAFNTLRLGLSHQLDVRIDKEFYFGKWILNLYLDLQNAYNHRSPQPPIYTNLDASGVVMSDPLRPASHQLLRPIIGAGGTILPTLGVSVRM